MRYTTVKKIVDGKCYEAIYCHDTQKLDLVLDGKNMKQTSVIDAVEFTKLFDSTIRGMKALNQKYEVVEAIN